MTSICEWLTGIGTGKLVKGRERKAGNETNINGVSPMVGIGHFTTCHIIYVTHKTFEP